MEQTMYHMLLRLPLFQGMSREDLFCVLEQTTFHFRRIENGKTAFRQGDQCQELTFLMSGMLVAETQTPHAPLSFAEELAPYMVLEPQSLFGKRPNYKSTYVAQGEVSLLCISKREVYRLLETYEIFRINFLNMLCSKTENLHECLWSFVPQGLEGRMALFIYSLCTTSQGTKVLRIKMEDLASLLDDTRLNVSRVLNKWREEGYIIMHRREFVIPDIQKLIAFLGL